MKCNFFAHWQKFTLFHYGSHQARSQWVGIIFEIAFLMHQLPCQLRGVVVGKTAKTAKTALLPEF